jgi:ribonuclease HI
MTRIVNVWTDGACTVNTRKGGWGVVLQCPSAKDGKIVTKELSGSSSDTTNNLMELQAMIEALKVFQIREGFEYNIHTDSKYVMLSLLNREEYELKGFKKVKNVEKLQELYSVLDSKFLKFHTSVGNKTELSSVTYGNGLASVNFIKVDGHSDNVGNNRADELAVQAKSKA